MKTIALIGFGEAARAVAGGITSKRANFVTYDIKFDHRGGGDLRALAEEMGVQSVDSGADAIKKADYIFSLVTAAEAVNAARTNAAALSKNQIWFDMNSCAPKSKAEAASAIESAGARYVDTAVMAPVYPKRHQVPMLLSGSITSQDIEPLLKLGMNMRILGEKIGMASSVKMMRSVMIKGLEALSAECVLGARKAGVDDFVIESLEKSDPEIGWPMRLAYNLERMTTHGKRRAEEMAEVAKTLDDLGIASEMARATTLWQSRLGALGLELHGDLETEADTILAAMGASPDAL